MKFTELESKMFSRGIDTLAKIARELNTTPQAVSNWKARNQVPHRIEALLNKPVDVQNSKIISEIKEENIQLSDILLTLAKELKIIIITAFIALFTMFTYVRFIQVPMYMSSGIVLFPSSSGSGVEGLSGLASQFGVNMANPDNRSDLSSPYFFPELLKSRTFAEKILFKKFFSEKKADSLSLIEILIGDLPVSDKNIQITSAFGKFSSMVTLDEKTNSSISVLSVSSEEPSLSKDILDTIIVELELLHKYYKNQKVNQKIDFIENRIISVEKDLEKSELNFKFFNEQNRQLSSPSLKLQEDRLSREVEVQKRIFLTLKEQLELAKIEEIQESSIIQILDQPQIPLGAYNKNLKLSLIVALSLGLLIGIIFGFIRSYLNNENIDERRKLRRVKTFVNKKLFDVILDYRVSGIVSLVLFIGMPFYIGGKSSNPVYFGRYSSSLLILNLFYIIILIITTIYFLKSIFSSRKHKF